MRRRTQLSTRAVAALLIPLYALIYIVPVPVWAGDGALAVITVGDQRSGGREVPLADLLQQIRQDPDLLVRDKGQVRERLRDWVRDNLDAVAAGKAVSLAYRGRVESAIARAWEQYYRFEFRLMQGSLDEADGLLENLHDTGSQSGYLFELRLLGAMAAGAVKGRPAWRLFVPAARLKPGTVLPEDKYSPEVVGAFDKAAVEVNKGPRSTLTLDSRPTGARVLVDGVRMGTTPLSGADLTPGDHFIQVKTDGYADVGKRVVLRPWKNSSLQLTMDPLGPAERPELFFSKRLKEGAVIHLAALASRLEVGHLLFLEQDGGTTRAWLVGSDGEIDDSRALRLAGQDRGNYRNVLSILDPLRVERGPARAEDLYLNMPPLSEAAEQEEEAGKHTAWYAVLGGVLLISLAAGAGKGGSGSGVEVSW